MGWWRFDELAAATVRDMSDLENHGTFRGDPQRLPGKIGQSLAFNGTTDYVDLPVTRLHFPTTGLTLALWVHGDASLPVGRYGALAVSALRADGKTALAAMIPFPTAASSSAPAATSAPTARRPGCACRASTRVSGTSGP